MVFLFHIMQNSKQRLVQRPHFTCCFVNKATLIPASGLGHEDAYHSTPCPVQNWTAADSTGWKGGSSPVLSFFHISQIYPGLLWLWLHQHSIWHKRSRSAHKSSRALHISLGYNLRFSWTAFSLASRWNASSAGHFEIFWRKTFTSTCLLDWGPLCKIL